MNRIRRTSLGLAALSLFAAGLWASSSDACSCIPPPEPAKALAQSAAVFLAKVIEIDDAGNVNKTVTLEVEKWWKGGEAARVKVVTPSNGAACGFSFQVGERYLVYAHGARKNDDLLHSRRSSAVSTTANSKASAFPDRSSGGFRARPCTSS